MLLRQHKKEGRVTWLTLFASTGTLVCCALPIMLVTLGMGATVVAMTSTFPVLITLSLHKSWVFVGSGLMLVLTGWLIYRPGRVCPADQELDRLCNKARTWNRRIYWTDTPRSTAWPARTAPTVSKRN